MSRKAESLPTLAANGYNPPIQIEVVPAFLPPSAQVNDPTFRATVVNPGHRKSAIRWHLDGQLYSLTGLTSVLHANHGVKWPGKTCRNWRRCGQQQSLWDEAEKFPR
jgi:hypothetical protein